MKEEASEMTTEKEKGAVIKEGISKAEALAIKEKLEAAGATVEIRKT